MRPNADTRVNPAGQTPGMHAIAICPATGCSLTRRPSSKMFSIPSEPDGEMNFAPRTWSNGMEYKSFDSGAGSQLTCPGHFSPGMPTRAESYL